jgi:hypothetical protein
VTYFRSRGEGHSNLTLNGRMEGTRVGRDIWKNAAAQLGGFVSDMDGAKGKWVMGNVRRSGTYLVIASEYHDRLCDAGGLLIWGSRNAPE